MSTPYTRSITAHGELHVGKKVRHVALNGTYEKYGEAPVKCVITTQDGGLLNDLLLGERDISFLGQTENGESVVIFGFNIESVKSFGTSCYCTAKIFMKGDLGDLTEQEYDIEYQIFLPPTPIIPSESFVNSFDGTVKRVSETESNASAIEVKNISWSLPIGNAKLVDKFEWHTDTIGLNTAHISVQQSQIHIQSRRNFLAEEPPSSIGAQIKDLPSQLEDSLWLISFLSHRRIDWYALEIRVLRAEQDIFEAREALARRECWLGFNQSGARPQSWIDLPLKRSALQEDLFSRLYSKYSNHAQKIVISQTIGYLLTSYEPGYLPAHISAAYAAMEGMVSGLAPDSDEEAGLILSNTELNKLKKAVSKLLDSEVTNEIKARAIKRKLGELNRRAFIDRLLILIKRYQLPIEKIWHEGPNPEDALRAVISRRHKYIHQGRMENMSEYIVDYRRIRVLVEIWILRLLDCSDDNINQYFINIHLLPSI